MRSFIDPDWIDENISAAGEVLGLSHATHDRRAFYMKLAEFQAVPMPPPTIGEAPSLAIITPQMSDWMRKHRLLSEDEVRNGRHHVGEDDVRTLAKRMARVISRLTESGGHHRAVVERCLNTVVVTALEDQDGGSVSAAIGFIYLAPKSDWSDDYLGEMVLHESIHNRLFLLDMVEGLFPDLDALDRTEAQALSAIRQVKRPYDKAFHSCCVSYTLVRYHQALGNNGRAESLRGPLKASLADLKRTYATCREANLDVATPLADQIVDFMMIQ